MLGPAKYLGAKYRKVILVFTFTHIHIHKQTKVLKTLVLVKTEEYFFQVLHQYAPQRVDTYISTPTRKKGQTLCHPVIHE